MSAAEEVQEIMAAGRANGGQLTEEQRLRLSALLPIERAERNTAERTAALAGCAIKIGDRVLHKNGGSEKKGADARVGIVRRVYAAQVRDGFAAKLSVDWPAPHRINGDGWHRSAVLATAVIPATEEEIERRRGLNRALRDRVAADSLARLVREAARRGE